MKIITSVKFISFVCIASTVTVLLVHCERRTQQDGGTRRSEHHKNIQKVPRTGCSFPSPWRGFWSTRYHGFVNNANNANNNTQPLHNYVNITSREIEPFGSCVWNWRNDYYLTTHNNGRCHVCLLILHPHEKVLQVKQTSCVGIDKGSEEEEEEEEEEEAERRDNTKERRRRKQERKANDEWARDLCLSSADREENFLTFIKDDVTSHPCPLGSPHHFVYSIIVVVIGDDDINNTPRGICFCRSPLSYLHHCSDVSRLHFRLRKCNNCPGTMETEIEFVCLAGWKSPENETTVGYFPGEPAMMLHSLVTKKVDSIIYATLSVSNNLTLQSGGHNVAMQLTEDTFSWSAPACLFPDWLGSSRWSTFDGRLHFVFPPVEAANNISDSKLDQLKSFKLILENPQHDWLTFNNSMFKCLKASKSNQSLNDTEVTSFMTQVLTNCSSAYRCFQLRRHRVNSVALMRLGEKIIHLDEEDDCDDDTWTGGWMLLVNTHILPEHCPFTGQYVGDDVTTRADMTSPNCKVVLKSGCPEPSSISITSQCSRTSVSLECMAWWSDEAKIFLLARNKKLQREIFQCYSFDPSGGEMLFQYEEYCQFAEHVIKRDQTYNNLSFTFKYELEPCSVQDELASWSKSHRPIHHQQPNRPSDQNPANVSIDFDGKKQQPQVTGNRIRESEMFPTSGHVSLISSHVMNDENEWRSKNMRSPFVRARKPVVVGGSEPALNCDVRKTRVVLKTIATVATFSFVIGYEWTASN